MIHTRILFALALWGVCCVPATAQTSGSSLLWKISGKGAKSSYLMGTIHVIPQEDFFLPAGLETAVKKSKQLVLEIPLDNSNLASLLSAMTGMLLPADKPLNKLLSESQFTDLQRFMKDSIATAIPMYERIKPIYLAQQLSLSHCVSGKTVSYETWLSGEFRKQKKKTLGLETVKEQMTILDSIPLESQVSYLMEIVNNPAEACLQLDSMFMLYRNQDTDALMAFTQKQDEMNAMQETLLDTRNQKWIPEIEAFIRDEKTLIAVGAGHLSGEKGVIQLLRNAGYRVEPVF
ncbi:MAG: TraB/GumN family protein [Bacteroidetes bacterium]|nr:MAG: TraB/GumN family protein [Bacteroidota bacterium]